MQQTRLPFAKGHFTPLGPLETPVDWRSSTLPSKPRTPEPTLIDSFRHSGWTKDRKLVSDALLRVNVPYARRSAFGACGSGHWVLRNVDNPETFKLVADHCKDRFCVPCSGRRQQIIRTNLAEHVTDRPHRFITLTLRHTRDPLADQIKFLYASFRKMRNRRLWKHKVYGGVAFLELQLSEADGLWHPHLHCIAEGQYFDLQDLKQLWLGVTGDSHSVQINLVRSKKSVIYYVTKYSTKPLPTRVLEDPVSLDEAIIAIRGTRMLLTFGSWKNWRLLDDPSEAGWKLFNHLNAVRDDALHGITLAQNILAMLPSADPQSGEFIVVDDGPPPDD